MEYVDGEDLATLRRRIGHLPRDKGIEIAWQICSGLAAIHDQGLLHRDLKPANVMIDGRGRARIADFGLAATTGETPPPEMVAAAGGAGGLRPAVAWTLLGSLVVSVPLFLALVGPVTRLHQLGLTKTPEALDDRAREMLKRLGHDPVGQFTASGFAWDPGLLRTIGEDPSPRRWDALSRDRPSPIHFWFRASPFDLLPRNRLATVSLVDPAPIAPGMATVQLDPQGRLLELRVVPKTPLAPNEGVTTFDGRSLLAEAGIDETQLAADPPTFVPPVFADTLAAWTERAPPDPRYALRIEAAALQGRAVYFRVGGHWSREETGAPPRLRGGTVVAVLDVVVLGVGLALAWRNWKRGRADRNGALRIAGVALLASLLTAMLQGPHSWDLGREFLLVTARIGRALYDAVTVAAYYAAIEPFVRRRWPDSLISWSRLLAGRIYDPRVGRDVLVTVAALWAMSLVAVVGRLAPEWWGGPPSPPPASTLDLVRGTLPLLAWTIDGVSRGLYSCLFLLVVVLVLRLVLRRVWAALFAFAAGMAFVLSVWLGSASWSDIVAMGVIFVGFLALLVRFGVLAMAVLGFFMDPFMPMTSHVGEWYGRGTLTLLILTVLLGIFGFVVSTRGQARFGSGGFADD